MLQYPTYLKKAAFNLGLITRTRSKEDRRVVEIDLTEKGAKVREILHNTTFDRLIHWLGTTSDHELLDIVKTLNKLPRHL